MPRPAKRLLAQAEEHVVRSLAFQNLRVEQRVATPQVDGRGRPDLHARLEAARPREADVRILRLERARVRREERDDVAEPVVEIRQLDLRAIVREALVDADLGAARAFRLEVGVSAEERRDAERLQHRRLLDAEAGARLDLRLAKNSGWLMRHVDHGPARYGGRAEAVVPLDPSAGGDEHARPEHLILSRRAGVVARVDRPGAREPVVSG